MAYNVDLKYPVYRSSDLDEVQGYQDLLTIWKAVRESEMGKRPPLTERAQAKIVKGLRRTLHEGKNKRTKALAASIVMAMIDKDWKRDVQRPKYFPRAKVARPGKAHGKVHERPERSGGQWHHTGQDDSGGDD